MKRRRKTRVIVPQAKEGVDSDRLIPPATGNNDSVPIAAEVCSGIRREEAQAPQGRPAVMIPLQDGQKMARDRGRGSRQAEQLRPRAD